MDNRSIEQQQLGAQLHQAEWAIHKGRLAVAELVSFEQQDEGVVDQAALEIELWAMSLSRQACKDTLAQLEKVKQEQTPPYQHRDSWQRW